MKVDFNNLRVQALRDFNSLVEVLNEHIKNDEVRINVCWLEKHIENLRMEIVTLACCYEDDNPEYRSVIDDVPEVKVFNPETE